MKPVIALVGRPNVGKSTLFNRLTRTRDALVADYPGLTRDRKYGDGRLGDYLYTVVDTGGIGENDDGIDAPMTEQSLMAVGEAAVALSAGWLSAVVVAANLPCSAAPLRLLHPLRTPLRTARVADEQ